MSYYGDIALGATIDIKFTTRQFTTGAPFALSGGVISAYVDNGTTEITTGITLSASFDSRTGLNNVRVVASSGNGFTTATNVDLVITTGTVDSVSVVGEVIGSFSIANRPVQSLSASTITAVQSGLATTSQLTTVEGKIDTIDTVVDAILVDTAVIGALGAGLTAIPWNSAWDAEVQSEAADALNAYDPPTKAELDAAVANVSVDEIQASALADLFNTNSGETYSTSVAGSVVKEIADNSGGVGGGLTAADVWTYGTRTLTALDEDTTTVDLDNTIRSAIGMSSANLDTQLAAIKADTTAILIDTNELQTDWTNGGRLDLIIDEIKADVDSIISGGVALTGTSVDAIFDEVIEGSWTFRQSIRLHNAAMAGKASGLDTTQAKYRDLDDTKDRINATVDVNGNRSLIVRDVT